MCLLGQQLPDHLVPHFIELVAECNVTMLHVVREAAVLRLASLTAAASSNIFHTASDSVANAERRQPLMWQSGEAVGTAIRELEELNGAWQGYVCEESYAEKFLHCASPPCQCTFNDDATQLCDFIDDMCRVVHSEGGWMCSTPFA